MLDGFPAGQEPTSHLYRNKRDGTFEDVTATAGIGQTGWGQGGVRRRLRQRRRRRSVRDLLGPEPAAIATAATARFEDVTARRRARDTRRRAGARAARSSTTTATAGSICSPPTTSTSISRRRRCPSRACAATRACRSRAGRRGCTGGKNVLYRNTRRRHVRGRVRSRRASPAPAAPTASASARSTSTTTGGSISTSPTTRIRARSTQQPRRHVHRHRRRRRLRLQPGRQAAGRHGRRGRRLRSQRHGRHLQDQLRRRHLDAVRQRRQRASATTGRSPRGIGLNTRWLGWGVGFVDLDNDGWLDLFLVNGHVYPEVERLKTEAGYKQRKVVYRNLGNGRFEDVTRAARPAGDDAEGRPRRGVRRLRQRRRHRRASSTTSTTRPISSRSIARPARTGDAEAGRHDVQPQRDRRARPAGQPAACTQVQEVRGGGSYYSQNDPRVALRAGRGDARSSAWRCVGRTAPRSAGRT